MPRKSNTNQTGKRYSNQQQAAIVDAVNRDIAKGIGVSKATAKAGIGDATYYRWRANLKRPPPKKAAAAGRELRADLRRLEKALSKGTLADGRPHLATLEEVIAENNRLRKLAEVLLNGLGKLVLDAAKATL